MRTLLAIINPNAGSGRCGRRAGSVLAQLAQLEQSGIHLDVQRTAGPMEAEAIARRAFASGTRDFLAVGGDGTAFEVANGVVGPASKAHERVRLGVLPLGTGNSLVAHFAKDVDAVLEALEHNRTEPLDVLRLRHQPDSSGNSELIALSTITLGIPTLVAQTVNRYLKPLRSAAYNVGALLEAIRLTNIELNCDVTQDGTTSNIKQETPLVAFQNTITFGKGMQIAPPANTNDGLGDLVYVDPVSRLQLLQTLPKVYDGSHLEHPAAHIRQFSNVKFNSGQEQLVMIDGEIRTLHIEAIDIVPGAIDLFI